MHLFGIGVLLLIISVTTYSFDTTEDVIWKDFDGTIPDNALLAGSDDRGLIYIGQVPYEGKVIPGKLYKNDKHIYFEFGEHAREKGKHIKILCTDYPGNFQWLHTKTYDFKRIGHHELVIGGYEPGFKTYIGKVIEDGKVDLGKVVCRENSCLALYTWHNGKYVEYHTYYILTRTPPPSVISYDEYKK